MKFIINSLLIFIILVQNIHAQKKVFFKNRALYLHDTSIYRIEKIAETPRTEHCKKILLNKEKKDDGKMEYELFVESKELIKVGVIFLMGDVSPAEPFDFLSEYSSGEILGPFKTNYGAFRFIEIIRSSKFYPKEWVRAGSKWMNQTMLDKEKAPIKRLKKIANQIVLFYTKGIGNEKNIHRKIKKFKLTNKSSVCDGSREAAKMLDDAGFCETWHILECEDGVLLTRLQKAKEDTEYIQYNEYIFK